ALVRFRAQPRRTKVPNTSRAGRMTVWPHSHEISMSTLKRTKSASDLKFLDPMKFSLVPRQADRTLWEHGEAGGGIRVDQRKPRLLQQAGLGGVGRRRGSWLGALVGPVFVKAGSCDARGEHRALATGVGVLLGGLAAGDDRCDLTVRHLFISLFGSIPILGIFRG